MRDLWQYRDLFRAFVARDIKIRYRQTALGVVWVLLQPLIGAGLFAVVFGKMSGSAAQGHLAAFLYYMAAVVPWTTFATAVTTSSSSLEVNSGLVSKVYFPRLIVPGAFVLGSGLDFAIAFTVLLGCGLAASTVSPWVLVTPILVLTQLCTACGAGFILAALNAQYHDVKYVVPFLLNVGLFLTVPPFSSWPDWMQRLLLLNPMTDVIESYRAIFAGRAPDALPMLIGFALSLCLLLVGTAFFRSREARLIDIL